MNSSSNPNAWKRTKVVLVILVVVASRISASDKLSSKHVEYFEKQVRPLLEQRCLDCHSDKSDQVGGNLLLDRRQGWEVGGDLGPAIVPGKPSQSLLIQVVSGKHTELTMPPDGQLTKRELRVLRKWIESGAVDPRDGAVVPMREGIDVEKGRQHWAFQSPHGVPQPIPEVRDTTWSTNALDRFILSDLEHHGLVPADRADKRTLIRRVSFDLTGLPPSPEEIKCFLDDHRPDAYERLIERFLASPRYGERWGRFWLDVARYADSNGLDENIAYGNAWRYRDYVIQAFNDDKPFDQFVAEQLAGDLLPPTTCDIERRQRTIATGFLSLGPKVLAEVDETKMEMDIVDEQVEVVGRAFMGLTLGCARCHDHKFDPISTEDYYALAGIFKSTRTMEHFTKIARWNEICIATERSQSDHDDYVAELQASKTKLEALKQQVEPDSEADPNDELQMKLRKLQSRIERMESLKPALPFAMAVSDHATPTDLRVHLRGSFLSLGESVARGFPSVLTNSNDSEYRIGKAESGRLQLAHWLVDGRHPLVARVMVNRIWRWHFGWGLVESTDNFGLLGSQPRQQQLLDWLAVKFVADGWSIKSMHRLIMLSSTYRMNNKEVPANVAIDPENRLHWRRDVRRLEAEAIRDSILYVGAELDTSMGGSLLHVKNREFLFDHTSKDHTDYSSLRRSIYLPVVRNHLYDAFHLFDYSDASVMNSNRSTTTVAPQALFMMNGELTSNAADALAQRICADVDPQTRIRRAYEIVYGRLPTETDVLRATEYVKRFEASGQHSNDLIAPFVWRVFCHALMMSNEFVYVH